ncbi:hypothetical protein AB0L99_33575 [Streptomyces sp. NPDC051954]|uniref:hypothetical protein n=1 Tax=Streptomyces sp. NPDC051954 TaxID=3155524 RepID=UPI003417537F
MTVGAHLGSLRLVSFDGTTLDMPDTRSNASANGYPGSAGEGAAFPQLRLLTPIEDGPRAPWAATIALCHGKSSGERTLLARLLKYLEEDMLATADAGLFGFDLRCRAEQTGAELPWRVVAGPELPRVKDLGDGSYLTLIYAPPVKTAARAPASGRPRRTGSRPRTSPAGKGGGVRGRTPRYAAAASCSVCSPRAPTPSPVPHPCRRTPMPSGGNTKPLTRSWRSCSTRPAGCCAPRAPSCSRCFYAKTSESVAKLLLQRQQQRVRR